MQNKKSEKKLMVKPGCKQARTVTSTTEFIAYLMLNRSAKTHTPVRYRY